MAVSYPVPTEPSDREEDSFPDPANTLYRKACRRSWVKLIAKIYLVSPRICPKCRGPMKIIAFLENPPVIRKILQLRCLETTAVSDLHAEPFRGHHGDH